MSNNCPLAASFVSKYSAWDDEDYNCGRSVTRGSNILETDFWVGNAQRAHGSKTFGSQVAFTLDGAFLAREPGELNYFLLLVSTSVALYGTGGNRLRRTANIKLVSMATSRHCYRARDDRYHIPVISGRS
jgi:hypothetical protein